MTSFPPSGPADRWRDDYAAIKARLATVEQQLAQGAGAYAVYPCTSTTHPANPKVGAQILETDTGALLVWDGTAWRLTGPRLLSTTVLASAQPSVPIAVPAGWPRLQLVWRTRSDQAAAAGQLYLRMNGDTNAHYLWQVSQANNNTDAGNFSGGLVTNIQIATIVAASATAGYLSSGSFTVDGASDTVNCPTVLAQGAAIASTAASWVGQYAGLYTQPGPVSSLTVFPITGNLVAGSTFTLYGLQ